MFIELIDALRCPVDHDESWLVARIDRLAGRYLADGSLGCPVCRASYPVEAFIARFGGLLPTAETAPSRRPTDDALLRLAALLDLRSPGGYVGLAGRRGRWASALAAAFDVQCVVLDPPSDVRPGDGLSIMYSAERIPLAPRSLRALAVDADAAGTAARWTASLMQAVQAGGRIVAPVAVALPLGVRELARDAEEWVAEREAAPSPPVPLGRPTR